MKRSAKQPVVIEYPSFSPKNVVMALKDVDIAPKSFFSKYAINAIAKTTPCLKKW